MHCHACGSRLVKNGCNKRIAVLDNGLGRHEFQLERKRCPRCGEITPDHSKIAPKHGMYHENYKRRARQHYMEGLMPSQIQRVFQYLTAGCTFEQMVKHLSSLYPGVSITKQVIMGNLESIGLN